MSESEKERVKETDCRMCMCVCVSVSVSERMNDRSDGTVSISGLAFSQHCESD